MHQPQPLTPALCQPHRPSFAYPSPHHMPTPAPEPTMDSSPRAYHGLQPPSLPWTPAPEPAMDSSPRACHGFTKLVPPQVHMPGLQRAQFGAAGLAGVFLAFPLMNHGALRCDLTASPFSMALHDPSTAFDHFLTTLSRVTSPSASSVCSHFTAWGRLRCVRRCGGAMRSNSISNSSSRTRWASMASPQLPWPSPSFHGLPPASMTFSKRLWISSMSLATLL